MTRAQFGFTANADGSPGNPADNDNGEGEQSDAQARIPRRLWPVWFAAACSFLWLALAIFLAVDSGILAAPNNLSLAEIAALIAGAATPVGVFWLMALAFQRSDPLLEHRLAVSRGLNKALAPIDAAEIRVREIAQKLKKEAEKIGEAADLADNRIDNLENRFKEQISELFAATTDAEAKATNVKDVIKRERDSLAEVNASLKDEIGEIETSLAKLTGDVRALMETVKSETEASGTSLRGYVKEVSNTADTASSRLTEVGETVAQHVANVDASSLKAEERLKRLYAAIEGQAEKLAERVSKLDDVAAVVAQKLTTQARTLTELASSAEEASATSELVAYRAIEKTRAAGEGLKSQVLGIESALDKSLAYARQALDETGEQILSNVTSAQSTAQTAMGEAIDKLQASNAALDEHVRKLDGLTDGASGRLDAHAEALRGSLESNAAALESLASERVEVLETLAASLTDQAGMISRSAKEAAENMRAAGSVMDERSENLGQSLEDTKRRLEGVGQDMEAKGKELVDASEESISKLAEAAEAFKAQSATVGEDVGLVIGNLQSGAEKLQGQTRDLKASSAEAQDALAETGQRMADTSKTLTETAERVGREQDRLSGQVAALDEAGKTVAEATDTARREVDSAAGAIELRMTELRDTSKAIGSEASSVAGELGDEIKRQVGQAGDIARDSMAAIRFELDASASALESKLKSDMEDAVKAFEEVSKKASAEAANTGQMLSDQADRLVGKADLFAAKTEEVERKLKGRSQDDFVRTSSLLIDSLHSTALDLSKVFETEISEAAWRKYLDGEKGIFARRAVALANRSERQVIIKKFEEDREFREHVAKFTNDFEQLMDRAMETDNSNTLSIALISSDMGKLYVLLSQALKRLA